MDEKHKWILDQMLPIMARDLDVDEIICELISEKIVTVLFNDELMQPSSKLNKAMKLLRYLKTRGPKAYEGFKKSLMEPYFWMVDRMNEFERQPFDGIDVTDTSLLPGQSELNSTPSASFRLPAIPPLNVPRKQKMDKLRDGLIKLEPNSYLVLHAMPGWGKSTLLGATLERDGFGKEHFQDGLYWIKFRQHRKNKDNDLSDNILHQLNELLHEVKNLDELTEPTNRNSLIYFLRRYFTSHENALIILDDVDDREIIDDFDFNCKILVLTTNTDVLSGKNYAVIKMDAGFTLDESLSLFAKAIGTEVSSLPSQAKRMHEECKGMPFMISLYASRFQEIKESLIEDKDGTRVWSAYLNDSRKESPKLQNSKEQLAGIFGMCINYLTDPEKNLYEILSIFPEDVNITPKMLSVAWNVDSDDSTEIIDADMLKFYKKAMVFRHWNEISKEYVYGVHDLMSRYLREKFGREKMKEQHRSYLEKHFSKCNGDYSKLLRDNYVYAYIGYHMKEAELFEKFSEIYLDPGFIEARILETGPGDLFIDLKKYRKYIAGDCHELNEKINDLKSFLVEQASALAEYRRRNCLDFVQLALQHSKGHGFVRDIARRLIEKRQPHERVYFESNKLSTEDLDPVSYDLPMQVRAVAFTDEPDVILVGTDDGQLVRWNSRNRRSKFLLTQSDGTPVRKIVYSHAGQFCVSLDDAGTAKLFDLEERFDIHFENHRPQHANPEAKQNNYQTMNMHSKNQDHSRFTIAIPDQRIADVAVDTTGTKIAFCTVDTYEKKTGGYIAVWNAKGQTLMNLDQKSNPPFVGIAYMFNDQKLFVVNQRSLVVHDASDGKYNMQFSLSLDNDAVISLHPVDGYANFLVVLTEKKLLFVRWNHEDDIYARPSMKRFAEIGGDRPIVYKSAVVTSDGNYVAASDTGGSVSLWKIDNLTLLRIFKKSVASLCTRPRSEDRSDGSNSICGCTVDGIVSLVHKWNFNAVEERDAQRLPLFDAVFETQTEKTVVAVATLNDAVKVIHNGEEIAESDPSDGNITCIAIFDNGNSVVYSTVKKSVYVFDIRRNANEKIMELSKPSDYVTVLRPKGNNLIVCQNDERDSMIWKSKDDVKLVENTGTVLLSVSLEKAGLIITVSKNTVKLWDNDNWSLRSKQDPDFNGEIKCCSLSNNRNLLSIANAEGRVTVYKLSPKNDAPRIVFEKLMERNLASKITACNFSSDDHLLAVGLFDGRIIIFDARSNEEIREIKFHIEPIKQLYWSPLGIEGPILLSLSNELAWWSVEKAVNNMSTEGQHNRRENEQRRCQHQIQHVNRPKTRMTHSQSDQNIRSSAGRSEDSTLVRSSTKQSIDADGDSGLVDSLASLNDVTTPRSLSLDSSIFENDPPSSSSLQELSINESSLINSTENEESEARKGTINDSWRNKRGMNLDRNDLLSVIKLDGNSATQIRMSESFGNFVTIDGEGSIYTMTLRDYDCPDS